MGGGEVIELSVDETNALRIKLGLAPLKSEDKTEDDDKEVNTANQEKEESSRQKKDPIHKPAENLGAQTQLQERLERARLERQVQQGLEALVQETGEEDAPKDALSFAARMRATKNQQETKKKEKKKSKKKQQTQYGESDLQGLAVSHNLSHLESGATTVLTLKDASILQTQSDSNSKVVGLNDSEELLENAEFASREQHRDRLKEKRQVELGAGRAGGYAGYDDDEFAELGGTRGPSRQGRGGLVLDQKSHTTKKQFRIGEALAETEEVGNDLFASQQGRAISLASDKPDVTASDFMTNEEYEASTTTTKKSKKKKKKEAKFSKKRKKEKKHHTRKRQVEEEEDDERERGGGGLLQELEETAVVESQALPVRPKKRRRADSNDDDDEDDPTTEGTAKPPANSESHMETDDDAVQKRKRFDAVMAKGNARTKAAFQSTSTTTTAVAVEDEEPDDAFLTAALSKARRLRRLKEMAQPQTRGADAVAQALVQRTNDGASQMETATTSTTEPNSSTGLVFATDDTREFTRALRARAVQAERQQARKEAAAPAAAAAATKEADVKSTTKVVETVQEDEEMEDIAELAKEIKHDDGPAGADFDGSTANQVSVGRGIFSVLSALRHTGEITGKNAGREELRGRAKDKRTYEDYEKLDLNKVVKINERTATDKDRDLANREIKLEYRDEHGRLLTRKEAYRNLCYQFHGHGSSKKNEERRLRQIEREQAEARVASRQVADDSSGAQAGSLAGALKATQRATGKAFIVHKT